LIFFSLYSSLSFLFNSQYPYPLSTVKKQQHMAPTLIATQLAPVQSSPTPIVTTTTAIATTTTGGSMVSSNSSEDPYSPSTNAILLTKTETVTATTGQRKPIRIWVDGCYDVMHHGHFNALRQAKEMGDIVVAGVHSDAELLVHKGPTVMNENER
jgi:cytidyltransferase-like protein